MIDSSTHGVLSFVVGAEHLNPEETLGAPPMLVSSMKAVKQFSGLASAIRAGEWSLAFFRADLKRPARKGDELSIAFRSSEVRKGVATFNLTWLPADLNPQNVNNKQPIAEWELQYVQGSIGVDMTPFTLPAFATAKGNFWDPSKFALDGQIEVPQGAEWWFPPAYWAAAKAGRARFAEADQAAVAQITPEDAPTERGYFGVAVEGLIVRPPKGGTLFTFGEQPIIAADKKVAAVMLAITDAEDCPPSPCAWIRVTYIRTRKIDGTPRGIYLNGLTSK